MDIACFKLLNVLTVLQPGDMDVRFSHLCVEYQEEMTDNSWAGKPEIIALCTLLNCNCIVWELLHGYAREVFRNIQDLSSSTTKTVHLHLANKEHYEFTDIPQVHAFLNSCSILFLTTLHFSDRTSFLLKFLPTIIEDLPQQGVYALCHPNKYPPFPTKITDHTHTDHTQSKIQNLGSSKRGRAEIQTESETETETKTQLERQTQTGRNTDTLNQDKAVTNSDSEDAETGHRDRDRYTERRRNRDRDRGPQAQPGWQAQ